MNHSQNNLFKSSHKKIEGCINAHNKYISVFTDITKCCIKLFLVKILFLFFSFHFLYSQTPPYYHYTTKEGLSSNTVFDLIQDREGFIWIATNNGVCRFDGRTFTKFGVDEGLSSSTVVSLIEGSEGEIYFGTVVNGVNLYKNGLITSFTPNENAHSYIQDLFILNNKLYAHSTDGFLITYRDGKSLPFATIRFGKTNDGTDIITTRCKQLKDRTLLAFAQNGIYKLVDSSFQKMSVEGLPDEEMFYADEDGNGNLFVDGVGKIFIINNNKVIRAIKTENPDDKLFKIKIDSKGNIWYSVMNKGFRVIYQGSDKIVDISEKLKIPKASVNKIAEDREGNIWVTTFGKGVFCLNNLYIRNYNEDDGLSNNNVQAFEKDGFGRMIIGTYNGINIFEDERFNVFKFGTAITDYVYELHYIDDIMYCCASTGAIEKVIKKPYRNTNFIFFHATSFCKTNDSNFLIGEWGDRCYQNKSVSDIYNKYFIVFKETLWNNRINEIFEDTDGNLWFGTNLGFCKMKDGVKTLFPDKEVLNAPIQAIIQDKNNTLWIAGEKGVAKLNPETNSVTEITEAGGYSLTASTSLALDNKNRIWIGNMKGLYRIDKETVDYFNINNGLQSNEVLSLFYDEKKDEMYIGTSSGFSMFDIKSNDEHKILPLKVKIYNVSTGDSVYTNFEDLTFPPDKNNLMVSFIAMDYSSPLSVLYSFKLNDNEWSELTANGINFNELSSGEYNLLIRSKSLNGSWSEPSELNFIIKQPYYKTFWFVLLMAFVFIGFILFIAAWRISVIKKRDAEQFEIEEKVNELQHQAVAAQMNPHFIFNSLASVQYFVNQGKTREANDYIALMARLIRMNLDLASKPFLTVEEEANRLRLYLDIEMLRFEKRFIYSISVDERINPKEIAIPNMIIQPFVENSIWHGFTNLNEPGNIRINFNFEEILVNSESVNFLIIRVTDNGVGLEVSSGKKKEGHTSRAISIIKQRFSILSKQLNYPEPVDMQDLGSRNPDSHGTEVILSLPPGIYRIVDG